MSVPGGVYKIVLDTGAAQEEHFSGLELEVQQEVEFLESEESGRLESVEILPSQEITYIHPVFSGSHLTGEKVDLFLEYGPSWRSDLLHDLQESCLSGDLLTFPVFCRDGVFWSSKLLLASVSKMLADAISVSESESCLVIPDISKHDLLQFYTAAFTGDLGGGRVKSIKNVASTLALHHLLLGEDGEGWEEEEEEEEDEEGGVMMKCLKKSDKIKLSQYFQPRSDLPPPSQSSIQTLLRPFAVNSVECNSCGRKFSGVSQLERHRAVVHSKSVSRNNSEFNNPYHCPYCDRRFAFQLNVKRHCWLLHQDAGTKVSGKTPHLQGKSVEERRSAQRREKLEDIKCSVCGKYFLNWKKLQLHMLDHTSDRPFKCRECGKGFKEESKLKRHSVIHTGEKPFDCSYCGKSFSLKQNKEIHERLHTGEGFECGYCGEIFSQKVNLRKHEIKHERRSHVMTEISSLRASQACTGTKNRTKPPVLGEEFER